MLEKGIPDDISTIKQSVGYCIFMGYTLRYDSYVGHNVTKKNNHVGRFAINSETKS